MSCTMAWSPIVYITAFLARTTNKFHNAVQLRQKINHMFSEDKILSFNDPRTNRWYSSIKHIVYNNAQGITSSEIKEATRLTASLSTLTTTVIPLRMSSNKCKNAIVSKTMMIPVIIFNSSTTFEIKNGQLQKRYMNASSYILLSEDSIISQSTKLFGQRTQVIGRSCTISTTSGNFLYEKYHFTFEGQIVLIET